jgi:hypothetical protein
LNVLLTFIGGTVGGAALKALGTPGVIVGSLVGMLIGWIVSRRVMRRLF